SNECRRIARTYTLTNWCEWDGFSPAVTISRDEDCNLIEGETDVWVVRTPDTTFVDVDEQFDNLFPADSTKGISCDGMTNPAGYWRIVNSTGRWEYTQVIQIFDETPPLVDLSASDSLCIDQESCLAFFSMTFTTIDACQVTEGSVEVRWDLNRNGIVDGNSTDDGGLSGNFPHYTFGFDFPEGIHNLRIVVTDDCGNTTTEAKTITIVDCYVPELTCYGGRIYDLEPLVEVTDIDGDGALEEAAVLVEAVELGTCVFADCGGELFYSVNRVGETPDMNQTSLYLDCNDRYQVALEVYVWDNTFNPNSLQPNGILGGPNWRNCTVEVFVQDPNLACADCQEDNGLTIAGRVRTTAQTHLENVEISLASVSIATTTSATGRFQLRAPADQAYQLRDYKNDDTRVGLSTLDMVFLHRHIIGQAPITDAYQRIAADINNDGEINVIDLLQLQAVILGVNETFPSNFSWRFVPYDWNGEYAPTDGYALGTLGSCVFDQDLTAIKVGDLNGSYFSTSEIGLATGHQAEEKSLDHDAAGVRLLAHDQNIIAGETFSLHLELPSYAHFQGGQLSLQWAPEQVQYIGVTGGVLEAASFNENDAYQGLLRFNYAATLESKALTQLTFRALQTGKLSDFIHLCDLCSFSSEVYATDNLVTNRVALVWQETATATDETVFPPEREARLGGAFPNPVRSTTQLSVFVPAAQSATLVVMDVRGRKISSSPIELIMGENQLTIDATNWPAGVYTYSIQLQEELLSSKIIKR
ncbi:MAG: T9SS type A sorting domain-containing protein, partial [Bacteroidota bacterium]